CEGVTTLAVPRSLWTSATAVYHAPVNDVQYHCHPRGKIQGYFDWSELESALFPTPGPAHSSTSFCGRSIGRGLAWCPKSDRVLPGSDEYDRLT
ncbi:MAG: hypothetical protein ABIQ24_04465, partial [Nitrospiraceae bacterium]